MNNTKTNRATGVYSLFAVLSLFMFFGCETDESPRDVYRYNNLVFEDNFDIDGVIDPSKWSFDTGRGMIEGWGNGELQYYTDRTENVKVENGFLVITARQEDFEGSSYTSGRIKTENLFEQEYDRFEARIRFPYGQGLWPAFWMLGNTFNYDDFSTWPECGEIDVFEYVIGDRAPSSMAATLHGPGYSAGESISRETELEESRFDTEFHTFSVEWSADGMTLYLNGIEYDQITREDVEERGEWVFNKPFFMILNLAVGGFGQPGPANVNFPQTMLVDYVRAYQ